MKHRILLIIIASLCMGTLSLAGKKKEKRHVVRIETSVGNIRVALSDDTPLHTKNFLKLARKGYYDGTLFHRCIKDFMIQGGDPDSRGAAPGQLLGEGGPGYTIPAEFCLPYLYHWRGALAAAREPDDVNPDDGQYTVFGEVIEGMEVVKVIQGVETDENNRPLQDVVVRRMVVEQ